MKSIKLTLHICGYLLLSIGFPQLVSAQNYLVQSGDTLWDLAREYDTTVENIKKLNPELYQKPLRTGTTIQLPKPQVSTPRPQPVINGWTSPISQTPIRKFGEDTHGFFNPDWVFQNSSAQSVVSAASGEVVEILPMLGYGQVIFIRHAGDLISMYACERWSPEVYKGQKVGAGEKLGTIPANKRLRFALLKRHQPINPAQFIH